MSWKVKTVKPLPNYELYVEMEDGKKGVFDLKPYVNSEKKILQALKDIYYFNQVGILYGSISWPDGQDIAPDALLAELKPLLPKGKDGMSS